MKTPTKKNLTLKSISKSNVWDIQENDVFRLLNSASRDPEFRDNINRYIDIFKTAFNIEPLPFDNKEIIKKYEARGYKVAAVTFADEKKKMCVKKRPINRVTDLTIRHISVSKLLEVLESNFGGGWESISQSIRDIIESGFDISTTTLPKERLRKKGSMYEKKVEDGFEVLEIPKGGWIEAIFAKAKPTIIKELEAEPAPVEKEDIEDEVDDNYNEIDEDQYEEEYDEEQMIEESYRTTFETDPEDLTLDNIEEDEYED